MGDPFRTRFRPTGYAAARRIASRFNRYRGWRMNNSRPPDPELLDTLLELAFGSAIEALDYKSAWEIAFAAGRKYEETVRAGRR